MGEPGFKLINADGQMVIDFDSGENSLIQHYLRRWTELITGSSYVKNMMPSKNNIRLQGNDRSCC